MRNIECRVPKVNTKNIYSQFQTSQVLHSYRDVFAFPDTHFSRFPLPAARFPIPASRFDFRYPFSVCVFTHTNAYILADTTHKVTFEVL